MFRYQSLLGRAVCQVMVAVAVLGVVVPLAAVLWQSVQGEGLTNYVVVVAQTPFLRFLVNSAVIAFPTAVVVATTAVAAGYGMSVLRAPLSGLVLLICITSLALPAVALTVPLFSLVVKAQLMNNPLALIIPLCALNTPFAVLLARNYMANIPVELHEAAQVDGAGPIRTFLSVMVPMSLPIISVIAVFTFLGAWNEFFLALLFLQKDEAQVVTQVLQFFQAERRVDVPKVFAANVLISVPVVLVYLVLQRRIREAFASGALK